MRDAFAKRWAVAPCSGRVHHKQGHKLQVFFKSRALTEAISNSAGGFATKLNKTVSYSRINIGQLRSETALERIGHSQELSSEAERTGKPQFLVTAKTLLNTSILTDL